jgi:hypothetical protein
MSRNGRSTTTTAKRPAIRRKAVRTRSGSDAARLKAQYDFLRQLLREKQEAWDAMTPAQRRAARAEWKRFVKSINEGRRRKVIVE